MNFDEFWIAFKVPTDYTNRYRACSHLWEGLAASRQQELMDDLNKHAAAGTETEQRNPYYYIKDFSRQQPRRQRLSFRDYYAHFHTTEEQPGWRMIKPETGNVYYEHV